MFQTSMPHIHHHLLNDMYYTILSRIKSHRKSISGGINGNGR